MNRLTECTLNELETLPTSLAGPKFLYINKIYNLPSLHLHSKPSSVSIHTWVTGSHEWWLLRHSFSGGHLMKFHEVSKTFPVDLNFCNFSKLPKNKIVKKHQNLNCIVVTFSLNPIYECFIYRGVTMGGLVPHHFLRRGLMCALPLNHTF